MGRGTFSFLYPDADLVTDNGSSLRGIFKRSSEEPGKRGAKGGVSFSGPAGPAEDDDERGHEESDGCAEAVAGGKEEGGRGGEGGGEAETPKKQTKKKIKAKSAAKLQARALRQACVDATFKHCIALAQLFLVQSSMRMVEIFTCVEWNPTFSTLAAYPPMACGSVDVSAESMQAAATQAQGTATAAGTGGEVESLGEVLVRPPGAVAMAVMLYPPHFFAVLILGNAHIWLHQRLTGRRGLGRRAVKYHVLVSPFEKPFWWWNMVGTARQLVLVFCITLEEAPERQALVALLATAANLLAVLVYRPYKSERCNIAEAGGQLLLGALLLTGLLNPTDLSQIDTETLTFPNDRLITLTVLVLTSMFGMLASSLVRREVAEIQLLTPWW